VTAADVLRVQGIRCYGYTGYFPEENRLGQWFEVNLTFWLDLGPASRSDELSQTLNYCIAVERTTAIVKSQPFKTIERLAGAIAEDLLSLDGVDRLKVALTKVSPPIPDFAGQVTVELTRSRSSST
jgi:7,8-dihydroneopterin aldolase/epimerase/oxygenase